jgi:amino acid transporter
MNKKISFKYSGWVIFFCMLIVSHFILIKKEKHIFSKEKDKKFGLTSTHVFLYFYRLSVLAFKADLNSCIDGHQDSE